MVRCGWAVQSLFVFKEQDGSIARRSGTAGPPGESRWHGIYGTARSRGSTGAAVWSDWTCLLCLNDPTDRVELHNGQHPYLLQRIGIDVLQHHVGNALGDPLECESSCNGWRDVLGPSKQHGKYDHDFHSNQYHRDVRGVGQCNCTLHWKWQLLVDRVSRRILLCCLLINE